MKQVRLTENDKKMIVDAGQYLSENLNKRTTIPQLAVIIGLSEKKLKAGFLLLWGTGVHSYLTGCRMEKVKLLLLEDQPLKAIANSTGYTDKNGLIKAFRKRYGVSPTAWRKQDESKFN